MHKMEVLSNNHISTDLSLSGKLKALLESEYKSYKFLLPLWPWMKVKVTETGIKMYSSVLFIIRLSLKETGSKKLKKQINIKGITKLLLSKHKNVYFTKSLN